MHFFHDENQQLFAQIFEWLSKRERGADKDVLEHLIFSDFVLDDHSIKDSNKKWLKVPGSKEKVLFKIITGDPSDRGFFRYFSSFRYFLPTAIFSNQVIKVGLKY